MHFQAVNNSEGLQAVFSSVSSPRSPVKEPLVITHQQNKTLSPMAGSVAGDGARACGNGMEGGGGRKKKKGVA